MSITLMGVINDLDHADIGEMSAKQFMTIARIIDAREQDFKKGFFTAVKASCTEDEWNKLMGAVSMVLLK